MRFKEDIDQRLTGRHKKSFDFAGDLMGKVVLDVGCAFGWFERWAIERGCCRIIGIEPQPNSLEDGGNKVPAADFLRASAMAIPLEDESVDVAVMWEVLEHLPSDGQESAFREIRRVLRDTGEFCLSAPNSAFWSRVLDPAYWLIGHRHYSLEQIQVTAAKTGFEVVRVGYGGGMWESTSMLLLYFFKWVLGREIPAKAWFESRREAEFASEGGWTNIFVRMKKRC